MPRRCSICTHPEREAIDARYVAGEPARLLAAVYGVSDRALRRHAATHLPAALVSAQEAADAADADDLLAKVAGLEADARRIGATAEKAGDVRTALAAVRELTRIVELLAKLRGAMDDRPQISIHVAPEWREVRQVVLVALAPFPDARVAVAGALASLEASE